MLNLVHLAEKQVTATVDYQAGARGSVRNVCDRDLQPWHWRLSAFGSRYLQIQPLDLRNCGNLWNSYNILTPKSTALSCVA